MVDEKGLTATKSIGFIDASPLLITAIDTESAVAKRSARSPAAT
jgi:hypothetical protein